MNFNYDFLSDIGTTRESNQDSVYAGCVITPLGTAFLGVICDGMGGLSHGELASQTVTQLFRDWFLNEFAREVPSKDLPEFVFDRWGALISKANRDLLEISENSGEQMGTTLSVLLIVNDKYYAAQIGDSRIYCLANNNVLQITNDHSYVMELVQKGMMTETEARLSSKRNVLTRCVGAVRDISGDFYIGEVCVGDCFLISSDGFHGRASLEEMGVILAELNSIKRTKIKKNLAKYVDYRKSAGEKDNITVIYVKLQ